MGQLKRVLVLGLVVMLGACATGPSVMTDYDTAYDYAGLETFEVIAPAYDSEENILISPFTYQHLERVAGDLLSQRYRPADENAEADFEVRYHIVMEERLDARSYDMRYGFGYYGFGPYYRYPYGPPPVPRTYNQGSLIVDIVDGETGQPIWRGIAEERLYDGADPATQRQVLSAALADVLSQFPPVQQE